MDVLENYGASREVMARKMRARVQAMRLMARRNLEAEHRAKAEPLHVEQPVREVFETRHGPAYRVVIEDKIGVGYSRTSVTLRYCAIQGL